MNEKYITHLDGIPNDKFTISDTGIVMNKYSGKELAPSITDNGINYSININHYENRKRKMYKLNVVNLVYMYYGDSHGFDINNPLLWIYLRDGCYENMSINNLKLCLNKTNIPVIDVYKIYDHIFKTGDHDNIEISKMLGYFIPDKVINRLMYNGTEVRGISYDLSKLFGYNLREMRKICLQKSLGHDLHTLSENEVHLICKSIVENGPDVDYIYETLKEDMPGLIREKIFNIIHKKRFTDISDKYFDSALSMIRGENDPPLKNYPDLPGEIWKQLIDDPDYYVSNKGRIRNQYGRIMKLRVNGTTNISVTINKKAKSVPRLVISTFGLDLPKLIGMSPKMFEVDHLDGDPTNNVPENLLWIPRGARLKNGGYSISDVNEILKILNDTRDRDEIQERIKNEICNDASIGMINRIIRGAGYSYLLRTRDNIEWRPIVMRLSNTSASYESDTYEISESGKIREIESGRYLTIYQEPLRELNFVDINGSPRRVDRMVYDTYVGFDKNNYLYNNKLIHINKDTLDDTPSNLKYIPSRKYTDYQTKYEKLYHQYGIREIWKKFTLDNGITINVSNFGRIRYNGHFIMVGTTSRTIDDEQYAYFTICGDKTVAYNKSYVLRNIVYQAFVGDIGHKQRLYEIDGDPMNCHVCNLELDYVRNDKRSKRYKNHSRRIMKIDDVNKISTLYDNAAAAGADDGTSAQNIRQRIRKRIVINGVHWEYV